MFSSLGDKLSAVLDKISGRGVLKSSDIEEASREIKMALLSADVHFKVAKEFVEGVSKRALGEAVLSSLNASQVFTKIVNDELVNVLGGEATHFDFSAHPPLVILFVGLQGSGKTTTTAKFAKWCKKKGRTCLLVPADVKRPAAVEQLKTLSKAIEVNCYDTRSGESAVDAVKNALGFASQKGSDTVIIDTAGRLHIDDEMMDELKQIVKISSPHRILYVADAMTGQDAVNSASVFNNAVPITGVVFTKVDGDSRGGAVLSVKHVISRPVLFVGSGEKIDDFEIFDPKRMADRILGMGDVVGLVERVQDAVKIEDASKIEERMKRGEFTLDDFSKQLKMMDKIGSVGGLLKFIPGISKIDPSVINDRDIEKEIKRKKAILSSMTPLERKNPNILNGSRKKRIASGSGTTPFDVNNLLKEYEVMSKMIKRFSRGGIKNLFRGLT